jgi:hypothetical protein
MSPSRDQRKLIETAVEICSLYIIDAMDHGYNHRPVIAKGA